MSRQECLRAAMAAVKLARNFTEDVQFSAEDATRSDPASLWQVIEPAGSDTLQSFELKPSVPSECTRGCGGATSLWSVETNATIGQYAKIATIIRLPMPELRK
jgi:HMGL-like